MGPGGGPHGTARSGRPPQANWAIAPVQQSLMQRSPEGSSGEVLAPGRRATFDALLRLGLLTVSGSRWLNTSTQLDTQAKAGSMSGTKKHDTPASNGVPVLDGSNYTNWHCWHSRMFIFLRGKKLWKCCTVPIGDDATKEEKDTEHLLQQQILAFKVLAGYCGAFLHYIILINLL
ncbi:hypothetical protein PGTUg99_019648 [Puccinia graminis f. sp. tritici]|uniref:DUF4219 domain-containing protein n=1 Tax=Puccinia graminis f. sp. tritici TaxID=56615 RepID=A0A5B0Q1F2_PUCGR|nr:hypothetical protein PGTUg99_019648 [Puccinia graminis f. sp. tritici]